MTKKHKLFTMIKIVAITTAILHLINKLIFYFANNEASVVSPLGHKYKWRYGNIYYTKQGNKKPLLLIHDLKSGSSNIEWKHIANYYSATHTVYCIDLIGCGNSDKPKMTYSNYLYVQLIRDFVTNVIGGKTDVIVTGDSCSVVTMVNMMNPSLLDQIILINPGSIEKNNQMPTNKDRFKKKLIEFPVYGTFIYNIMTCRQAYKNIFLTQYFSSPNIQIKRLVNTYHESAHLKGCSAKYLMGSILGKYTYNNISRSIKEAANNIYIINGEYEPGSDCITKEYKYINKSIQIRTVNQTTHLPHLEAPQDFINVCENIL